jgi:hypothetical protein
VAFSILSASLLFQNSLHLLSMYSVFLIMLLSENAPSPDLGSRPTRQPASRKEVFTFPPLYPLRSIDYMTKSCMKNRYVCISSSLRCSGSKLHHRPWKLDRHIRHSQLAPKSPHSAALVQVLIKVMRFLLMGRRFGAIRLYLSSSISCSYLSSALDG